MIFFASTVVFDQLTKYLTTVFGRQVYLNPGISFAWLANETQAAVILLTFIMIVLLGLRYGYFWAKHPVATGLFFGGAFSNLIDRLVLGGVRDWIPVPFLPFQNNLADLAIWVSLAMMIWYLYQGGEDEAF